jgi:hypothetical protein
MSDDESEDKDGDEEVDDEEEEEESENSEASVEEKLSKVFRITPIEGGVGTELDIGEGDDDDEDEESEKALTTKEWMMKRALQKKEQRVLSPDGPGTDLPDGLYESTVTDVSKKIIKCNTEKTINCELTLILFAVQKQLFDQHILSRLFVSLL